MSLWPHAALGFALVGITALVSRHFLEAAASLSLFAATFAVLAPHYKPDEQLSLDEPWLSVVWMNIHHYTDDLHDVTQWATDEDADIVLIGEPPATGTDAPEGWQQLNANCSPFVHVYVRRAGYTCSPVGVGDRPAIKVEDQAGFAINIVGIHATAPFMPRGVKHRQREFRSILDQLGDEPVILVGDLNTVPWSKGMDPFRAAGFRRLATGQEATWLSPLPAIGLPIDHALYRGDKSATAMLGPWLKSDHRPLIVHLSK